MSKVSKLQSKLGLWMSISTTYYWAYPGCDVSIATPIMAREM